jgi:tyrosyl-tRNA synthetase
MAQFDPTRLSIDEQVDFLLEDTYFADEGGTQAAGDGPGARTLGLRAQMRAELKAKLELSAKLREKGKPDWPLRVYIGADPTRTSLHIGHMVPVTRLRRFQLLGHQAIFLIGDYTAMIGDPTDQGAERAQLSHETVIEMSRFYTDQAHRLLHADTRIVEYPGGSITQLGAQVRYNGEWLAKLGFGEIAELAAQFPVSQVIAREDFRVRLASGSGVRLHETMYMLMQGYDAYALNCDVQVGGYDQHFNLLAGRELQEYFARKYKDLDHPLYPGQRVKGPHVMLTVPLLMGTDGRKMSKSWGNTIDVLDTPEDMFGKVMRISDAMIPHYIDIAVEARPPEKDAWKARAASEPMEVKKWIAHSVTALYNGAAAADRAAEHFRRTVQEKSVDLDEVPEVRVPDAWRGQHLGLTPNSGTGAPARGKEPETEAGARARAVEQLDGSATGDGARATSEEVQQELQPRLVDLMLELKLVPSKSEARRLIEQGGVKLDGAVISDQFTPYIHVAPTLLQVGKRKIVRLV